MPEEVTIPARFNGPPGSANGGYACGVVAALVGAEEVAVSLRQPPPLERPLTVVRADGAGTDAGHPPEGVPPATHVELRDGDTLVAEGEREPLMLDVPDAVSPDEAAAASEAGRERWSAEHPFPTCVVCGPDRVPHDGLRILPGALGDDLYAAEWTPDESLSDGAGHVRLECVWAALDCPTSAPVASFGDGGPPMVLGRLVARLGCSVRIGERHALVSWPLGIEGRKRRAACALFDSEGRLLCASRALWIELRV